MLSAKNISFAIGKKIIVQNLNLHCLPGKFCVLLGPNGSGKTTLLKLLCGAALPQNGDVFYNDINIKKLSKKMLASMRAVMSQQQQLAFPISVEEVVMMGRYPHFDLSPKEQDKSICRQAMQHLKLQDFAKRNYQTLSGGEKQRVQFARVLAQIWQPGENTCRILFLDEPLNNLDIKYQLEFLQTVKAFIDENTIAFAVLHDINLALQFGDKLFFMKQGNLVFETENSTLITRELVKTIFDVDIKIIRNDGRIFIAY